MKRRIYRIKRESSKEPGPSLGENSPGFLKYLRML